MYDSTRQYRCTIIRGKSQKEIDDLLPVYAKVINEICPCRAEDFEALFNDVFKRYIPKSQRIKKTFDNHRTEISGKLFGMYYFSEDGNVYESERTQKFLEDNDQPAFFKDICYKMQFPNGSQKSNTLLERINNKIKIRPNAFLLKFLLIAKDAKIDITKKDIGYYILNSLDVLQGIATPHEVLEIILKDKQNNIEPTINVSGKASSYSWQHINEQMNYLELANLIRFTADKRVILNPNEMETIELFADGWDKSLMFDVYAYDLSTVKNRKRFQYDWDLYYGRISDVAYKFTTSVKSLIVNIEELNKSISKPKISINYTEVGNEGEQYVFEYEKKRVAAYNKRLANKVLWLGKIRGIGYDIQSVIAESGGMAEFVKYIEVKSTKRFTCPDINDNLWIDTLNITRNEWIAAKQHGEFYSIFRVYFTSKGIFMFVLKNPMKKYIENKIEITPMTYRVDFTNIAIDDVIIEPNLEAI